MRRQRTCETSPAWLTPVSSPARVGVGCGIPLPPRELPHGTPGQSYLKLAAGRVKGCPRAPRGWAPQG